MQELPASLRIIVAELTYPCLCDGLMVGLVDLRTSFSTFMIL